MAEYTREVAQEYWRPASATGASFQRHGSQTAGSTEACTICGTPYLADARFCHQCGLSREPVQHRMKWSLLGDWMDLEGIRERTGLSTISLLLAAGAGICLLATIMTGMVYNTTSLAEWQAVQTWRIEWLLASVAALLGALLFKKW